MSLLVVLFSLLIAILFPLIVSIKYGVRPSISSSFYVDKVGYWFTGWCWGFSLPLLIFMDVAPLIFLTVVSFLFLGTSANYTRKLPETVHTISAGLGILSGFLVLILFFNLTLGLILFGSMVLSTVMFKFLKIKNFLWWVEIVAILLIYSGLIINLI